MSITGDGDDGDGSDGVGIGAFHFEHHRPILRRQIEIDSRWALNIAVVVAIAITIV